MRDRLTRDEMAKNQSLGSKNKPKAGQEETIAPMAASTPENEDRLAALERANIELETRIHTLERNCRASHGMR
jgi:hypothetical protein